MQHCRLFLQLTILHVYFFIEQGLDNGRLSPAHTSIYILRLLLTLRKIDIGKIEVWFCQWYKRKQLRFNNRYNTNELQPTGPKMRNTFFIARIVLDARGNPQVLRSIAPIPFSPLDNILQNLCCEGGFLSNKNASRRLVGVSRWH